MFPFVDLTGTKVGTLTFIQPIRRALSNRIDKWLVQCDCGATESWDKNRFKNQESKSDGYYRCRQCRRSDSENDYKSEVAVIKIPHKLKLDAFALGLLEGNSGSSFIRQALAERIVKQKALYSQEELDDAREEVLRQTAFNKANCAQQTYARQNKRMRLLG